MIHKHYLASIVMALTTSCNSKIGMVKPDNIYPTQAIGFSQAVSYQGLLISSGIVGWDLNHELTGTGDFNDQFDQAIENIETLLASVGCDLNDVLLFRFYVKELDGAKRQKISQFLKAKFKGRGIYQPATSIIGISALAQVGLLLEIEIISRTNSK